MYAVAVVLGLVAAVSAIDVYGYTGNEKCSGNGYELHTNVNPGDCSISASGNIYRSIGWRAIPSNWRIEGEAFTGGGCGSVAFVASSNGAENICAGGSHYSGGKYQFASARTKRASTAESGSDCRVVRRSDAIVFDDGTKYELGKLDDASHAAITAIFRAGGTSADVPAQFDAYKSHSE